MVHPLRQVFSHTHHTYRLKENLRFELAHGDASCSMEQTIDNATVRAQELFQAVFHDSKRVQLVFYNEYKPQAFTLKRFILNGPVTYIDHVSFPKGENYPDFPTTVTLLEVKKQSLRCKALVKALTHSDFLQPTDIRIWRRLFLYNPEKNIFLNIYDDRGCDIWSPDKENCRPIYEKYNDWLLDYDRKKIEREYGPSV